MMKACFRFALLTMLITDLINIHQSARADDLFVTLGNSRTIGVLTPTTTYLNGQWNTAGSDPQAAAFGPNGNLYVSYYFTSSISEYTPTGTLAGTFQENTNIATGVAFTQTGYLAITDELNERVIVINPNTGAVQHSYDIAYPLSVVAGSGSLVGLSNTQGLYVGQANGEIDFIDSTGTIHNDVADVDAVAGGASARGLAIGPDGNLYIACYGSPEIVELSSGSPGGVKLFATIPQKYAGNQPDTGVTQLAFANGLMYATASAQYTGNGQPGYVDEFNLRGIFETAIPSGDPNIIGITAQSSDIVSTPEPGFLALVSGFMLASIGVVLRRRSTRCLS